MKLLLFVALTLFIVGCAPLEPISSAEPTQTLEEHLAGMSIPSKYTVFVSGISYRWMANYSFVVKDETPVSCEGQSTVSSSVKATTFECELDWDVLDSWDFQTMSSLAQELSTALTNESEKRTFDNRVCYYPLLVWQPYLDEGGYYRKVLTCFNKKGMLTNYITSFDSNRPRWGPRWHIEGYPETDAITYWYEVKR